jgi:hypothetical protein
MELNRDAMQLEVSHLPSALAERIARRQAEIDARDRQFGPDRVRVSSYMENLGWPPLFGFDFNRFYRDPEFMFEQELRQRIFWLDNTVGDDQAGWGMAPTTGFYWDITLFGQRITTTPGGIPEFHPHALAQSRDLGTLGRFCFHDSGDMPLLRHQYEVLQRLAREWTDGRVTVDFPRFLRGPLDILIQMRGYERFVEDVTDAPDFVHEALALLVAERVRFNQERAAWLGEAFPPGATFIADDWVNPPFISPAIFRTFIVPAYRQIQQCEGRVEGFHTCGPLGPLVGDLLAAFPAIGTLDVSGWNDVAALDQVVDPAIGFHCQVRNTTVLAGHESEHRQLLAALRQVAARRRLVVGAQSIVMLHRDLAENFRRLNHFVDLARTTLAG